MGGLVAYGGRDVVWSKGVDSWPAAGAIAVDGHFLVFCSRTSEVGCARVWFQSRDKRLDYCGWTLSIMVS